MLPLRRRLRGPLAACAVALLAALGAALVPGTASAASAPWTPPAQGALWGAYAEPAEQTSPALRSALLGLESKAGRRMAVHRIFTDINGPCVSPEVQWDLDAGRLPLVSWGSAKGGTAPRWSAITAGRHDAQIDRCAASLAALTGPVLFSFQHEPETHLRQLGTPAEYAAAFRHVGARIRRAGATNVSFVQIFMAWTLKQGQGDQYYAGGASVDYLGVDGYNWYNCAVPTGPWRWPAAVFGPFTAWAGSKGKPMIIAEWGTGEDPAVAGRKAEWIRRLGAYVQANPRYKAVAVFHVQKYNPRCSRYVDTSSSSLTAFREVGQRAWFSRRF